MLLFKTDTNIMDAMTINSELFKLFSFSKISEYNNKTGKEWIPFLINIIKYIDGLGYEYTTESFTKLYNDNSYPKLRYLLLKETTSLMNKCIMHSNKYICFSEFGVPENNGCL